LSLTFRHGDFEENTFYCAACSGWFAISSNSSTGSGNVDDEGLHHPYDDMLEKTVKIPQTRNDRATTTDPQIQLLRQRPDSNNSNDPKIYTTRQPDRDMDQHVNASGDERRSKPEYELKKMPTPQQIMSKLNDYVIGQKEVKVALSVGVYNHYKRIYLAESQQAMDEMRKADAEVAGFAPSLNNSVGGPSLQDMNLGQFGTQIKPGDEKGYCEAPEITVNSINSIRDESLARDVEDCEIDKSNILLLGPTGSGKVIFVL
jgi:hypothetical protein